MSISSTAPWLKFYGKIPHHIDYPKLTMYQLLAKTAKKFPTLPAYEFMGKKTDYRTFLSRIDRTARALYQFGIRKGDRVTICMPNAPQALDCFYALNRIGAISNMIHPLSAKQEIVFYMDFSESKAILTLDRFYPKVHEAICASQCKPKLLIAQLQPELPAITRIGYNLTQARKFPKLPKDDSYVLWTDLMRNPATSLPKDDTDPMECASILYSGGTTGTTKGICLSSYNFNALALQTIASSGYARIDGMSMLSIMPVFHGFGLGIGIHTALIGGAKCILVPNFSIKTYAKLLHSKHPNFIPGVPTLFEALLRAEKLKDADLSFLRGVFSGGDSLSVELRNKVNAFLKAHRSPVEIREGYGTTECVTASCLTPIGMARDGSIGIPYPDTYYKIVAVGTQDEVPADTEGEICLSGPTVMLGYLDNPKETADTLKRHADGRIWLHTGDLGKMDADGFIYFKQRLKRMIITSGYNVYPSQLENIIDGHEKVLISCVIGVKDRYKMQRVKAFVVLRPEYKPSEEIKNELLAYCRERVAKYAMPSEIEFREELPKTLVGKVAYRVLEEEAAKQA
ncbi:MAG: acyl--CoA ligase [Ruminococcaceae bacterium]|nr:acyl--CoA ligase [Oscillospiraceae bacterium]